MENFTLRFPLMTQKLLEQLDNESLVKSREISRIWKTSLDNNKCMWIRIIKQYVRQDGKFKNSWNAVLTKIPFEIVKELALAVKVFFKTPEAYLNRMKGWGPHHISAYHGKFFLFRYVIEKNRPNQSKS